MLVRVPVVKTQFSRLELCAALIEAWNDLLEDIPSKASIGIIVAQHGIETGGGNYCYNCNLANVKAIDVPGQTIEYMALNGVYEIINGIRVNLPVTNPGSWFRSFPDLHTGAAFHLNLLRNNRYKSSWPDIELGNLVGFATELHNHGYYTASVNDYIAGMTRFYNPYMQSTDYEQALASLNLDVAPPLQPWVTIPDDPAPIGELTVLSEPLHSETPTSQDIEGTATGVPLVNKTVGFFGTVLKWLKLKS